MYPDTVFFQDLPMDKQVYKSDMFLLITAFIWGAGFVAQRVGMDHMGPFTFNGIRFLLGAIILIPFYKKFSNNHNNISGKAIFRSGLLAGSVLFIAAAFQQYGLVYTTAGKAGFITGLYVIIVPFLGLFFGFRANAGGIIGALLATTGLYLLSVTENLTIDTGDALVLGGAVFWALHVLVIGILSPKVNGVILASLQFAVCGALSIVVACFTETITITGISGGIYALLFGGIFSVAIAYTLQVIAQKDAPPVHAAIILSLESVFGALTGWLLLNEIMTTRSMTGCILMLSGMITAQVLPLLASKVKSMKNITE